MEIKLKAAPSDADKGIIVDEYGALWRYSGPETAHGIFLATTKGLDGEAIQGFYQNRTLFIVNWSDAKKYFNSMNLMNYWDGLLNLLSNVGNRVIFQGGEGNSDTCETEDLGRLRMFCRRCK